jgi:FKBP-type peptidyl-prolyl cis-trans isomerase
MSLRASLLLLPLLSLACAPALPIEKTTFAASLQVDLAASTKLPSGMYVRDLVVGTGVALKAGDRVSLRYTGWLADGTQFDSNQVAGFPFTVGAGQVIPGWDLGTPGLQSGGTRQLIIPPELGYGADGSGPIPPNAVLVFNVTKP